MQSGSTPATPDYFQDVQPPAPSDMEIQLQQLVQQGALSPEDAQAAMANPSAMNNISTDPKLKQAQMDALSGLQDISSSGGMTDADRANLSKIQTDANTAARGQREAILQNAQSRGLGGSGLELMAQLQNQQDSATRQSQQDMTVAGTAQQRALDALIQGGTAAGNIQNQAFNQQAQTAQANDAISKFNAQNQQQANLANTAARNDAAAKNLAVKQGTADINTQMANQQQQYNKNLLQQNYDNELKKRGGEQGVAQSNSQAAGQNSQNQANATNQTIGTGLSAAAMFSDARGKKDVKEFSPSDFLDSLTSYKYKYKDPKNGAGEHVGPMAQDLEKTDMGSKMVVDTPKGKVVDYAKGGPAMVASLADLHKRLKEVEGKS